MPAVYSKLSVVSEAVAAAPSFDDLFRRYAPYVAAIGLRLLGRPDETDDLVQDVFLAVHRGLDRLRDPRTIRGWLATIAVRMAGRRLRRRRLRRWVGLDAHAEYGAVLRTEAQQEDRALVASVYRALDLLPAAARIAWCLRYMEGEPLSGVAALAGCSLATAKRRIAAAQAALEEALSHA